MKFSFSNILESRIPVFLLTVALVLTGTVFGWFIWRVEQSKQIETLKQEILTNPAKTGDSIVYLNELLAMSAQAAVITGNLEWEKEFKKFEPDLEKKIDDIKTVLPDSVELQSVNQLETANLEMLTLEKRAFTFLREGRTEHAKEVLFSDEFKRQKEMFLAEIPNIVGQLNEMQRNELSAEYQYSNRFIGVAVAVFILSLLAWIVAIRKISISNRTLISTINEKDKTQAELIKSQQYQNLFRLANDAIIVLEPETEEVLDANDKACQMYGFGREKFVGMSLKTITKNIELGRRHIENLKNSGTDQEFETIQYRADGTPLNLLINSSLIEYQGGQAILSINRDITERKRGDAALRESEYKMRTLLDSMSEGLIQVDKYKIIEFVNDRFCEMTEYDRKELLGSNMSDLLIFDDEEKDSFNRVNDNNLKGDTRQYELKLKKKSGESLYVIVGDAPVFNAEREIIGTMGVFTDITERKQIEEQMVHDAFHDALTGLANRKLFMEHLRMSLHKIKRESSKVFAVLFLDFDRFKVINDSLGHTEGDKLLIAIAGRLEFILRPGDLVARLGGDEFTILLSEINSPDDALFVAERIQQEMKHPFDLGGSEIVTSASIGIAYGSNEYAHAEEILRDADIAMYRAKAKGKACYQIFDQSMHEEVRNKLHIEREMRQALEQEEFQLYYQPIVDLDTGDLSGFESLIRWQHPIRGMVPPGDFIPIAEENNMILPLGKWILYESCRQMRAWQKESISAWNLMVSVNLSGKQFVQPDLVEQVADVLAETGLPPRCLKLEITESYLMENSELAVKTVTKLRELGLQLSLDDFGTGYSSLSYLHSLPVSYLKIDRSFVSRMMSSKKNSEMVQTIIRLAQNLRMKVIAEGIENNEQMAHLQILNCQYGQGYFFSKPLPSNDAQLLIGKKANNFVPPAYLQEKFGVIG